MGGRTETGKTRRRRRRVVLASFAVVLLCAMFVPGAYAGGSTSADDQYESTGAVEPATIVTKSAVATSTTPQGNTSTSGDLPFTGLSLLSIVVVGGALVGCGYVLRRRNTRDEL